MKLRWAALTAVLALSVLMPSPSAGQSSGGQPPRRSGSLKQNYPNPFNPETWIPFSIDCPSTEPDRPARVTIRIYNLLAQVVAIPVIEAGSGTGSAVGGVPIENLTLGCGDYRAYWNGNYLNSNREAASGVYLARFEVDGQVIGVRRILVTK